MAQVTHREPELLGIYLNDHLAGAAAGVDLARRLADSHRDKPSGPVLQRIAREVLEDRLALLKIMAELHVPVRRYKVLGAWVLEKVGRLKPNGHLLRRSALSSVLELEAMRLGIEGKGAGWRALRVLADRDDRLDPDALDRLFDRATAQASTVEELRIQAVAEALG
jgi:hypothetical protein